MVARDFNVISEARERTGRRHFNFEASLDFNNFIANASPSNNGYSGSKFTWCNNRQGYARPELGLMDVCLTKPGLISFLLLALST